jgi:hypothetical protein
MTHWTHRVKLCTLAFITGAGMLLSASTVFACEGEETTVVNEPQSTSYVESRDTGEVSQPSAQPLRDGQIRAPQRTTVREQRFQDQNVRGNDRGPDMRGENPMQSRLENSALAPLSFFVGTWNTELHMSADASKFPNAEMRGMDIIRPALNGNALIGNMEMQGPNNAIFKGHLVIVPNKSEQRGQGRANLPADRDMRNQPQNVSADNQPQDQGQGQGQAQNVGAENTFSVFWSDSMGRACFTNNASWDGTKLTVNSEQQKDGKTEKARVTYSRVSADQIDLTMERDTGNGWTREFNATMNRANADNRGAGFRQAPQVRGAPLSPPQRVAPNAPQDQDVAPPQRPDVDNELPSAPNAPSVPKAPSVPNAPSIPKAPSAPSVPDRP